MKKAILALCASSLFYISCEKAEDAPEKEEEQKTTPVVTYPTDSLPKDTIPTDSIITKTVVLIANEGSFGSNNASLSAYNITEQNVYNKAFSSENDVPLGDVANTVTVYEDKIYIAVNGSGKIYVADSRTYKHEGTIDGLDSPRDICVISETKAYVSDLYAKGLHIVDPSNYIKTGFINTDNGNADFSQYNLEAMIKHGKYVYATSWSYGDVILVIDSDLDKVVDTIQTPIQPTNMVIDKNNKLWCVSDGGGWAGNPFGYEEASLFRVDLSTNTIDKTIKMELGISAGELNINRTGDSLFFLHNGVVGMSIEDDAVPTSRIFEPGDTYWYGLAVSPYADEFYCADPVDFSQNGTIYRYSTGGQILSSFEAGVNPSDFGFIQYEE